MKITWNAEFSKGQWHVWCFGGGMSMYTAGSERDETIRQCLIKLKERKSELGAQWGEVEVPSDARI